MCGYDMVVSALNSLVSRSDEFSPLRDVVLGIYGKTPSLEEHACFISHGTFCVHKVGGGYSPRIEIQQLPADSEIFIVRMIVVVKEEGGISYKEISELTGEAHVAAEMFAHVYSGFLKDRNTHFSSSRQKTPPTPGTAAGCRLSASMSAKRCASRWWLGNRGSE